MVSHLLAALGRFLHLTLLGLSGRPHPVPVVVRASHRRRPYDLDR